VAPLALAMPAAEAWPLIRRTIEAQPRARIVEATGEYLHAEYRSRLFRFVDDLELHLRPDQRIIAVRSASRLGYSDFGVNRRRVETLCAGLSNLGVTR